MAVPDVLISGHHGEIERWRQRQRVERTLQRRPELLKDAALTIGERQVLDDLTSEEATRASS
jgi:tRNA (guanine37-N1)-methyltransferase